MKNYRFLFIISLILTGIFADESASGDDQSKSPCECGVLPSKEIKDGESPVFSHVAEKVSIQCPDNELVCNHTCHEIAKKAKEKGAEIICALYDHYENFVASIYYRSCQSKWMYSGLTNDKAFCCHDHKPTECSGDEPTDLPPQ